MLCTTRNAVEFTKAIEGDFNLLEKLLIEDSTGMVLGGIRIDIINS